MDVSREDVFKTTQSLAEKKDLFAASEYVLGLGNEARIVEAFDNLIFDCYYKAKSTAQVIHFGHAGIHYCLSQAVLHDAGDPAAAQRMRLTAKRMATNVASFTWPGWDEPGVEITAEQSQQGLLFARYSVRQLSELNPSVSQLAFTYWFLAAQLMANGRYTEALEVFEQARDYNKKQGDNPDGLTMLEGYIGLTQILAGQRKDGEAAFKNAVSVLKNRGNKDATFYAEQLEKALAVFEKPK